MSTYPLSGDFVFNYLGCTGLQYFPVTGEIDYLKIIPEEENAEFPMYSHPSGIEMLSRLLK